MDAKNGSGKDGIAFPKDNATASKDGSAVPKDGAVVKIVRHQCVAERCLF